MGRKYPLKGDSLLVVFFWSQLTMDNEDLLYIIMLHYGVGCADCCITAAAIMELLIIIYVKKEN
jgi:hypothetical protein